MLNFGASKPRVKGGAIGSANDIREELRIQGPLKVLGRTWEHCSREVRRIEKTILGLVEDSTS